MHDEKGEASFNLFGIKANKNWNGNSVTIDTLEVEKNEVIKKKQDFRMYKSFEDSFNDFINFISTSPRYISAIESVKNGAEFIQKLQDAGYATDPDYASKVLNILQREPIKNISELGR